MDKACLVPNEADTAAEHEADDRIRECVEALNQLGVPLHAGAPTAREALRDSGQRFGNDTIADAVKARKGSKRELSGTV